LRVTAFFACAASGLAVMSCAHDTRPTAAMVADVRREGRASAGAAAVDPAVDPCDDFYRYACHAWQEANPPVPDRPYVGRGMDSVQRRTRLWLWERLSAAQPEASASPLATFYASCMDDDAMERRGMRDVEPLRQAINAGTDPAALLRALGMLHRAGISALFVASVARDWEVPDGHLVVIGAARLAPVAHAGEDVHGRRDLKRYTSLVKHTLAELPESGDPAAGAAQAVSVERRLAAATAAAAAPRPLVAERVSRADFDRMVSPLPVEAYFTAAGLGAPPVLAVVSAGHLAAVRDLLIEEGPAVQAYLRWALLRDLIPHLPGVLRDARTEQERIDRRPRWQRCVETVEAFLPDEVAASFEAEAVSAETRAASRAIAEAVQRAAVRQLEDAAWLDRDDRRAAADKVARMTVYIGFPALPAVPLSLGADSYLANLLAAASRLHERMSAQIHAGADPRVGLVPTSTGNAFYRYATNDVVVPLALAQPPFFAPAQSAAANFGALGSVIGHEIGHAFDRAGRQVDADGRHRDWAAASQERVRASEICLAERLAREQAAPRYEYRFPSATLVPAAHVDVERSANEHLADIAGLAFAYDALREHRALRGEESAGNPDDEDRAFFLAYAQTWCTSVHPLIAHLLARVDPHAPPPARVNAALAQTPAFAAAYACGPGDALNPHERCALWRSRPMGDR